MIPYTQYTLPNGLRVVCSRDRTSTLAAVNLLYRVGARNEDPARTGFAHLFEHLMFRGTRQVPDFDLPVQRACGENNAFTNNDYTDFYMTLPVSNVETALWLESDRMTGLCITPEKLEVEKRVVVEEFRQRYLNQPYGDQMMLLRELAYTRHPYRWATIGREPAHIEQATLTEVQSFYRRHYRPSNAILSIVGDLDEGRAAELAAKWFADVPDTATQADTTCLSKTAPPAGRPSNTAGENPIPTTPEMLPAEPVQTAPRRMEVVRDVPATTLTLAFHMGGRLSRSFLLGDVVSDLLAGGESARLLQHLVRERRVLSAANAYVTGSVDPGLFVLTGQLSPQTTVAQAEAALWEELALLARESVTDHELEKVKNKFEANTLFGELNVMNKAMNLGFYDMLGDLERINREVALYRSVTPDEITAFSREIFRTENSSTLIYKAKS